MGLQVWLPLNGNLNNQGLSNVTATNNGATVDNNGKIGKCYSFSGSNYVTLPTTFLSDFTNEISVCAWINISAWNTQYDSILKMYASDAQWKNSIFAMGRNGTTSRLYFSIANGTSSTQSSCSLTEDQSLNTWYHIACVYNNTDKNMKIYLNGVLKTTYNTTIVPSFSSVTSVGIGGSPLASYGLKGKLNDVRIYNYALSAQEIKLISQGLILHYPLDRNGWGQDNLAHNTYGLSPFSTSQVEFKAYDVGVLDVTNGETITVSFFLDMTVATAANSGYLLVYNTNYKGPHQIVSVNVLEGRKLVVGEDIHERISFTTTINNRSDANRSTDVLEFYSNYNTENEIFISNIKVERGTKATQWSPNPSDTLYTTMDIGSTTEYDTSGYQNNGTKIGSLYWKSNSKKYTTSLYQEDGRTNYISTPTLNLPGDQITMNFWFKSSDQNPYSNYHMPFESYSPGQYEMSIYKTGYLRGGLYVGGSRKVDNCTSTKLTDGSWHMCTMTFDGTTIKRYVDAVMEKSTSATGALNTSQSFVIGLYGNNTSYGTKDGYTSDVRLYVTALSADDILELYNNKVI